ncbi:MAG: alpha/beta fold hydrolase [Dehalococcoidia bacterium]|nr:MAG: alpha/beta fold hydrolase [Dehalococcoidia bacterium]
MSVAREDVSFDSCGDRIAAWLYAGEGEGPARRPCVVIGHGFAAVKEARLDAFAERFAAAGFACLVFDYRHFGASGGMPRQVIDIRHQRQDWDAALRYARSLPDVDAGRIGIWGTSFGGGLAMEVAARDAGVRAAVFHMPLVDSFAAGRYEGVAHTVLSVLLGFRDLTHKLLRRPPYLVPVVGPPGSRAIMVTPEAEPGYLSIVTNAPSWRNEVAPRVIISMGWFRPASHAKRVRCPALFIVGESDTITPLDATLAAAKRVPGARVLTLPGGHFDAYLGEPFEQAVSAETAFYREALQGVTAMPSAAAG